MQIDSIDHNSEIVEKLAQFLTLPEKSNSSDAENDLAQKLGGFLANFDHIREIEVEKGTWHCRFNYKERKLWLNDQPLPEEAYHKYIFQLGKNERGEDLFPAYGKETDVYRVLHEIGHAYQAFLMNLQCPEGRLAWVNKVFAHEIDSALAILFLFCFEKRREPESPADGRIRGMTTLGNKPEYDHIDNLNAQKGSRALEDANELLNMALWNPHYLETYLDYLSKNSSQERLANFTEDELVRLSEEEVLGLKKLIKRLLTEMAENIK